MRSTWLGMTVGLVVVLMLVGVAAVGLPARLAESEVLGPEAVAEAYYGEWLSGPVDPESRRNPLADGSYRDSPYLTPRMIQSIDQTRAGFDRGGFDPCLCAQDLPLAWEVTGLELQGDLAQVWLEMLWAGNPMASRVPVILRQVDGAWQIDEVRCHLAEHAPLSPEQTVTQFYALYLDMVKRVNPLASGDYRYLPFLSPSFITRVETGLANMSRGGYDPFLCAQDIPTSVEVEPATLVEGVAQVPVRTSFEGHTFTVELRQENGVWAIDDIACQAR